jgi:hypothetical protein
MIEFLRNQYRTGRLTDERLETIATARNFTAAQVVYIKTGVWPE